MYVCVCKSGLVRVGENFLKYLLNNLDYIFQWYLILEEYILFRCSHLIQILIYKGFHF